MLQNPCIYADSCRPIMDVLSGIFFSPWWRWLNGTVSELNHNFVCFYFSEHELVVEATLLSSCFCISCACHKTSPTNDWAFHAWCKYMQSSSTMLVTTVMIAYSLMYYNTHLYDVHFDWMRVIFLWIMSLCVSDVQQIYGQRSNMSSGARWW